MRRVTRRLSRPRFDDEARRHDAAARPGAVATRARVVDVERPREVVVAAGEVDVPRPVEEHAAVVGPGESARDRAVVAGLAVAGAAGGVEGQVEEQPAPLLIASMHRSGGGPAASVPSQRRVPGASPTRVPVRIEVVPDGETPVTSSCSCGRTGAATTSTASTCSSSRRSGSVITNSCGKKSPRGAQVVGVEPQSPK